MIKLISIIFTILILVHIVMTNLAWNFNKLCINILKWEGIILGILVLYIIVYAITLKTYCDIHNNDSKYCEVEEITNENN